MQFVSVSSYSTCTYSTVQYVDYYVLYRTVHKSKNVLRFGGRDLTQVGQMTRLYAGTSVSSLVTKPYLSINVVKVKIGNICCQPSSAANG